MVLEADREFFLSFQPPALPGVPACFYDTIPNYAASNIQYLPTGITTHLTLLTAPVSARGAAPPRDTQPPPAAKTAASARVSVLTLSVIYHTEYMLQFKVIPVCWILVLNMEV